MGILAVRREFQRQFRYCFMLYRSSYGTDFENAETASDVVGI